MDRNRALGNAVVPQIAEWLGLRINELADELRPAERGYPRWGTAAAPAGAFWVNLPACAKPGGESEGHR